MYSLKQNKEITSDEIPNNIKLFLIELDQLCLQHDISITHEDKYGAFILDKYRVVNLDNIKCAQLLHL